MAAIVLVRAKSFDTFSPAMGTTIIRDTFRLSFPGRDENLGFPKHRYPAEHRRSTISRLLCSNISADFVHQCSAGRFGPAQTERFRNVEVPGVLGSFLLLRHFRKRFGRVRHSLNGDSTLLHCFVCFRAICAAMGDSLADRNRSGDVCKAT